MPLPDRDMEWPPPHTRQENKLYAQWGAWYSGDPDRLSQVYGAGVTPGLGLDLKGWDRPLQYAGGVVGRVARWFWGSPIPAGQSRSTKLHVPIAADISATSADLLFSEPPTLRVPGKKGQSRLDRILADGGVYSMLLESAEIGSAYGGVYLRVGWNSEIADYPILDLVPADAAVPEFANNRLRAVTFWKVVHEEEKAVWRHLERHETGRIYHGLYRGDRERLGMQVPLEDHPETAGFAEIVDAEGGLDTGYDKACSPTTCRTSSLTGCCAALRSAAATTAASSRSWTRWTRPTRPGCGTCGSERAGSSCRRSTWPTPVAAGGRRGIRTARCTPAWA
ncbi:hypothetical protein HNR40_006860 [Nonomuraea endophytica]|uniref:Uncharacterized protein n=1 Tax=Nonomuraea endophytica TaxID=714136 RepID=A0A7W8A9Z7_9ACTN|nr:hypothetical protein [Nonomuraea endophytica]